MKTFDIGRGLSSIAKELRELRERGLHVCVNNPDFESFSKSLKRVGD